MIKWWCGFCKSWAETTSAFVTGSIMHKHNGSLYLLVAAKIKEEPPASPKKA